jgi:hypothetical protein
MAACQEVRTWVTETVLVPVTRFITEAQEKCEEVREWIEEEISRPVEKWISKQEERCKELPWWNPVRWFCELVTVVVKVVEWVVETVGKWVVTLVCQIITIVIGVIVTFVLRVIGWFVTFLVCLFTDPLEALKSFRDLWSIVLDLVEDVFDFVLVLLDDIGAILTDLEELIDSIATSLGWLGVILGIIKGIIQLVRDLVNIVKDIVGALKDIILGILGLNLCRILRGLTDLGTSLGRAILDTGGALIALAFGLIPLVGILISIRVIAGVVAGIRDSVEQNQLEDVIRSAINNAFGAGSERATRSLEEVGVNGRPMGLLFEADARRLFLSSDSREPNLKNLHEEGVVDLYALAGYASTCKDTINQPDGEVVYAGTNLRVSYADLETFLDDGPGSVPEFHVFSITRAKFRMHLETVRRKSSALGVHLVFPTIGQIQATSSEHVPMNVGEEDPPGDAVQQQLFQRMGRTGVNDDLSVIPSISHFHYVLDSNGRELFGLTSWFRPSSKDVRLSGVTYRNRTPDWAFRWVLAHEIGHYWGLNHKDRSGADRSLDQIMYAPSTGVGLSLGAVLSYLAQAEPRFTLDDARTVWDWITTDGASSLLP